MYFQLKEEEFDKFCRRYHVYIKKTDAKKHVVEIDCEKLWTNTNAELSFPSFKHNIYDGKVFRGFDVQPVNYITISFHAKNLYTIQSKLERFFEKAEYFLSLMADTRKRLPVNDIVEMLPSSFSKSQKRELC